MIIGLALLWKAVQAEFREHIATAAGKRAWIVALGQFGYVTRGIVIAMIGAFLVVAAQEFSSGEAAGMTGAFRALQHQLYGPFLLGFAGAGFCSYGAFEIIQSVVRRIEVDAVDGIANRAAIWARLGP
jgi:hypothetical protein